MKTNTIYIQDWLEFRPYEKPQKSDFHYLKICNEVNEVFNEFGPDLFRDDVEENGEKLSCMLVTWFEDLVSDLGIWKAFINRHNELYNKFLPFYDMDDYYDGEPNPQDVYFLIWYFLSMRFQHQLLISPEPEVLLLVGDLIFDIFDESWDDAPVNQKLREFLNLPAGETDFYKVRFTFDWLVLNCYLFYFYGEKNDKEKIRIVKEMSKKGKDFREYEGLIHGIHDDSVQNTITSLLAMKGKDWLAYILGEEHPLHSALLAMSDKKTGRFLFLGFDDENISVKHISSGKIISITRQSIEPNNLIAHKTVLNMGIVYWQNEWWFSGSYFTEDYDDDVLLEETSNPALAGLFETEERKRSFIHEQYELFLEFNNQKPIQYFEDQKAMQLFFDDFIDFYNKEIAKKRGEKVPPKKDRMYNEDMEKANEQYEDDTLLFFNRDTGIELVFGYNSIIPDPDNPYYNLSPANKDAAEFYFGNSVSKDLVLYLSKINSRPYFKFPGTETDALVRENLDFLLRFFKPASYHSKAQITLME